MKITSLFVSMCILFFAGCGTESLSSDQHAFDDFDTIAMRTACEKDCDSSYQNALDYSISCQSDPKGCRETYDKCISDCKQKTLQSDSDVKFTE